MLDSESLRIRAAVEADGAALAAALLHGTIEDTATTRQELEAFIVRLDSLDVEKRKCPHLDTFTRIHADTF